MVAHDGILSERNKDEINGWYSVFKTACNWLLLGIGISAGGLSDCRLTFDTGQFNFVTTMLPIYCGIYTDFSNWAYRNWGILVAVVGFLNFFFLKLLEWLTLVNKWIFIGCELQGF